MDFPTAIRGLMAGRQFLAILPGGPVLVLSDRSMVRDVRNGHPRAYTGKVTDYLSIEWQIVTIEQLQQARGQAA